MKVKRRFLLPLIALFTLLMTCSAFAKPTLSKRQIILTRISGFGDIPHVYYRSDTIRINGLHIDPSETYMLVVDQTVRLAGAKIDIFAGGGSDTGGVCELSAESETKAFYGVYSVDRTGNNRVYACKYIPPKTYSVTVKVKDAGRTYKLPLKIKVIDPLANSIAYLQIGPRKYSSPFKARNLVMARVNVKMKKAERVYFKTASKFKKYKYFFVASKRNYYGWDVKKYKNGARVKLKTGDVIIPCRDWGNMLLPVTINWTYNKYKCKS